MNAIVHFDFVDTPLGRLRLTAIRDGLTAIGFDGDRYAPPQDPAWVRDAAFRRCAAPPRSSRPISRLERRTFDLPLAAVGTTFQHAVWDAIAAVARGGTISYAELARRAGHPGSARAVGAATGGIRLRSSCRVIGSSAPMVRLPVTQRLDRKRALLALEQKAASMRSAA